MKKINSLIRILILLALALGIVLGGEKIVELIPSSSQGGSGEFADFYADAVTVEETKLDEAGTTVNKAYIAKDASGSEIGYIFDATVPKGYGGPINFQLAISKDGVIKGFKPISHQETEGFGAKMSEPEFIDALKETNVSKGMTLGSGNKESGEISAISGATITSNALFEQFKIIVNELSEISDAVEPVVEEVPYFADKFQELFKYDISKYTFEELKSEDFYDNHVQRIIKVTSNDTKELDSYIVNMQANGFGGALKYVLRINPEYRVFDIVIGQSGETEGFGAYVNDQIYQDHFNGLNLKKNLLTKSIKLKLEPKNEKDILMISGATVTSSAMKNSLDALIDKLVQFDKIKDNATYEALNIEEVIKASEPKGYDHASLVEGFESGEVLKTAVSDEVLSVSKAIVSGEEVYIFDVNVKGFAPLLEYGVVTTLDGTIKSIVYYSMKETPDYGGVIIEDNYVSKLIGAKLSEIEKFTAGENIEAISGATLTTNAMEKGMNSVLEAFKGLE